MGLDFFNFEGVEIAGGPSSCRSRRHLETHRSQGHHALNWCTSDLRFRIVRGTNQKSKESASDG
jgi:hypothetical protein